MVTQRLTAINDALTKTRIQKAQLEARSDALRQLGDSFEREAQIQEPSTPGAANPTLQQLKLRYEEARVECGDTATRYLEHHPKREACEEKLGLARAAVRREIGSLVASAQREQGEASQAERNLVGLYNKTKVEAFDLNQYEQEYLELKRAYDNNQRLYELILKRLKDTGVTGMLQVSNVRILDRARPSELPVSPNIKLNVLLAVALGLLGGLALAFAAESIDTSITSQEDVEGQVGLPFLGIVPNIEADGERSADLFVQSNPRSPAAECLRSLRTNLAFMSPERPLKTILVTSSGPQEGKTTTAISLAETIAGGGSRVLLVDADLRRPRIHRTFGLQNDRGLSNLIVGDGTLEEVAVSTEAPNLWVLQAGPVPPNPAELLHTAAFSELLKRMSSRFDRVVVDAPPTGVVADPVIISTQVDGTLFVIRAGHTSRDLAKRTIRSLTDVNARVLGVVLNRVDLTRPGYGGHYYTYGYYYGERKGEPQKA
jgi:capsular exopolysaccharide synthesis family protein